MFTFTVPVFGVALSAWMFSEAVTPRLILGVAAVVSGILIATRLSHPRLGAQPLGLAGDPAVTEAEAQPRD